MLRWFEFAFSRLKINLEKSELILIGSIPNMELLDDELGCKVGSLPSTYLGLLLVNVTNLWQPWKEWKNGSRKD